MKTPSLVVLALSSLSAVGVAQPVVSQRALEAEQVSVTPAIDTIVSEGYSTALKAKLDAKYTPTQVCEDYELALHLMALVQSPAGRRGDNTTQALLSADLKNCPGTFSGVAKALFAKQASILDFHTGFRAGGGLDASAASVVTGCSDAAICGDTVGYTLLPVLTEVSKTYYVFVPTSAGGYKYFQVESLNGKNGSELFNLISQSRLISKTTGGNYGQSALPLLTRKILDGRDRADMTFAARELVTGARVTLTTSFAPDALRKTNETDVATVSKHYSAKSFGCQEKAEGSTDNIGACLTDQNRLVVWIYAWSLADSDFNLTGFLGDFFAKHPAAAKLPIVLDTRGNPGGNPYLPAEFLCAFGDDTSVREMKRRRLVASHWPELFKLSSGRLVIAEDLNPRGNNDLLRKVPGWHVSSLEPTAARKDFEQGFMERGEFDDAKCVAARDPRYTRTKWVVMTNGNEFSAAENFLSFIESSVFKFKIMGNRSWGGTGAPMMLTLPNTKMTLRLSQARHVDGIDGSFNIEGVGVPVHQPMLRELKADFEKRLIDSLVSGEIPSDFSHSPYLFRKALEVRM